MNYLKYVFCLFILVLTWSSSGTILAQVEPAFQMPLYFEDAVGNKDTVVVGYDQSVDRSMHPYEKFGEVEITAPFDSVFEVRCVPFYTYDTTMMKTLIAAAEGTAPNVGSNAMKIFIQVKYPPVTISYDSTVFHENMIPNTWFSRDFGMLLHNPEIYDEVIGDFHCARKQSTIVDSFKLINTFKGEPLSEKYLVEGDDTLRSLPGLLMNITPFPYLDCKQGVSTEEVSQYRELDIYPNPVTDALNFRLPNSGKWDYTIYDSRGNLNRESELRNTSQTKVTIPVNSLNSGVYFIRLKNSVNHFSGKFIKL